MGRRPPVALHVGAGRQVLARDNKRFNLMGKHSPRIESLGIIPVWEDGQKGIQEFEEQ